jgi:hypothetical protein
MPQQLAHAHRDGLVALLGVVLVDEHGARVEVRHMLYQLPQARALALRHRVVGVTQIVKCTSGRPTASRALVQVGRNVEARSLPSSGPMKTRPLLPGWAKRPRCQRNSDAIPFGSANDPSNRRFRIAADQKTGSTKTQPIRQPSCSTTQ